jgi:predicted nuclease of predicted toxin-antitoxin system
MLFIADENFPLPSVNKLRSAGHDVVAIITDSPGAADEEILARATKEARIVLTFDRDFGELVYRLRLPSPHGIVYFRFNPATPTEPAEYLLKLMDEQELSLEQRFTVADRRQVRQRPLRG